MMSFLEDVLVPLAFILGIGLAVIAALCILVASFNKVECSNLAEVTKRHTDFRWFGGCYVEHEGEMLPYERWKLLDVRVTNRN